MNGKELKEKLQAAGINLAELSRKMGYKTDQNLHSVLGAKEMSSGVIEKMAEATGKPISWFYGKTDVVVPAQSLGRPTGKRGKILGAGMFPKLSSNWARHTWATICAELDVPDPTITLGMGHKTAGHKTTAIYIKRNMKKVDEANRLVIDYIKETVPHLTAQDGTRN